jgi:hypothetical protein
MFPPNADPWVGEREVRIGSLLLILTAFSPDAGAVSSTGVEWGIVEVSGSGIALLGIICAVYAASPSIGKV